IRSCAGIRRATVEKGPPAKDPVPPAQPDHLADEAKKVVVLIGQFPIHPTHFIVLAPGVIIPILRAEEFITGQQHWYALRQQYSGHQVLGLSAAQCQYLGFTRLALRATVPAVVFIRPVPVVFAVVLVVLPTIADEVAKGEAVVTCYKVDGMAWQPAF